MKLNQFIAGCFGTIGFIVSIAGGLHADNGFDTILIRAMGAALGCFVIGYAIGAAANFIVQEHAQRIAAKVAELDAAERTSKEQQAVAAAAKSPAAGMPAQAAAV